MSYVMTSEFVTAGHPDRLADCVAAKVIDAITKKDGTNCHAAIEVFINHDVIHIGGEATTTMKLTKRTLGPLVNEVLDDIGYNKSLRVKGYTKNDVLIKGDYKLDVNVIQQSPDIARGVSLDKGFNDQGIFFGYAENTNKTKLGLAHAIAKYIGDSLMCAAKDVKTPYGPDIKVQVSVEMENETTPVRISAITIAAPTPRGHTCLEEIRYSIAEFVVNRLKCSEFKALWEKSQVDINWIINGTGAYTRHGSLGDSGLTGRKIVVNHSAGYSPNGGGSMIKGFTAADSLLNFASRWIAVNIVKSGLASSCSVALSCAIGQKSLQSLRIVATDLKVPVSELEDFFMKRIEWSPAYFNRMWETYVEHKFYGVVRDNFFGGSEDLEPWERPTFVDSLKEYFSDAL